MVVLEKGLSGAMNARLIGFGSEAIILAHGYGGDQSIWNKIIPSLSEHYQVLAFDWAFSGAVEDPNLVAPMKYTSYDAFANDLISVIGEMELISSVFVGHSMSGMIGCTASIKIPVLFKRLVPVGASPRYINTNDYESGFKSSHIDDIISNIESNFQNWASSFASLTLDSNDPDSVEKFTTCWLKMRPEVALSVAKTVLYCDQRHVLDKVLTPCTIVQTRDIVVPNSVAYYMQQKIKRESTVEIIDNEGHFPHLTAHHLLLDVMSRVLGFD